VSIIHPPLCVNSSGDRKFAFRALVQNIGAHRMVSLLRAKRSIAA